MSVEISYSADIPAGAFLKLASRVWPRDYDAPAVERALDRTINIGAWHGARLVGAVRILTDGYLFGTIPGILVDPDYQHRGIGRHLMELAIEHAPRGKLFFGAQQESVGFFERLGCVRGPTGFVAARETLAH